MERLCIRVYLVPMDLGISSRAVKVEHHMVNVPFIGPVSPCQEERLFRSIQRLQIGHYGEVLLIDEASETSAHIFPLAWDVRLSQRPR